MDDRDADHMPLQQRSANEWLHHQTVSRLGEQARLSVGEPASAATFLPQAASAPRAQTWWRGVLSFGLVGVAMVAVLTGVILLVDQYSPPESQPPSRTARRDAELERQRTEIEARIEALRAAGAARTAVARLAAAPAEPLPPAVLPEGVVVRAVLRYVRNSPAARTRALALGLTLRAYGLDAADPVATLAGAGASSVGYYYLDDRPSADRIAGDLAMPAAVQRHMPASGPLPRPGTIDVAITG